MYWIDNNTGIATPPSTPAVVSPSKRYFTNGGAGVQPSTPEDFWFHMVQEELLGILTLAGITPDKADLNQVAKAIQSIAFSAYPVGAPIPWPATVPPPGFIAMIGQSFSATSYPKLALVYPSLVLPDMRAMFVRGWDNGRGIDTGRAILSSQGDAIRNITGQISFIASNYDGSTPGTVTEIGALKWNTRTEPYKSSTLSANPSSSAWADISFDASRAVTTAAENRPFNFAFNYIVRAA